MCWILRFSLCVTYLQSLLFTQFSSSLVLVSCSYLFIAAKINALAHTVYVDVRLENIETIGWSVQWYVHAYESAQFLQASGPTQVTTRIVYLYKP